MLTRSSFGEMLLPVLKDIFSNQLKKSFRNSTYEFNLEPSAFHSRDAVYNAKVRYNHVSYGMQFRIDRALLDDSRYSEIVSRTEAIADAIATRLLDETSTVFINASEPSYFGRGNIDFAKEPNDNICNTEKKDGSGYYHTRKGEYPL